MKVQLKLIAGLASFQPLCTAALAQEESRPPIDLGLSYIADTVSILSGDQPGTIDWLDNLNLTATLDLDRLAGWSGGTGHVHVLNNWGGNPNNHAGTLQGVDNIEVTGHQLRLFEAWIEQRLSKATTIRAGLYDLNSEFYANKAAGLLIAPAFGVGSEIAATGPNGPSIFPSTALSVRINHQFSDSGYVRAAALNATAGTLGDSHGVNLTFDHGTLLIAETGIENQGKLAVGGWTYTHRQDDVRDLDGMGNPIKRQAFGLYGVAEYPINPADSDHPTTAFLRVGISDGKTTPFHGGWQAGLLIEHPLTGRPDSAASFGVNQGYLSHGYRENLREVETRPAAAETAFEITYSDHLAPFLTIQPDVQIILDAAGDDTRNALLVGSLRLRVEL